MTHDAVVWVDVYSRERRVVCMDTYCKEMQVFNMDAFCSEKQMNGRVLIVVSVLGWCKVVAGSAVTRGPAATTALCLHLTQLSVFLCKMMMTVV